MKKFLENLETGKKSAQMFRNLILQHYPSDDNNQDNYNNALDHHSMVALDTFVSSISMLKSCDFDGSFVEKRKVEDHLYDHDVNSIYNPSNSLKSSKMSCDVNGTRRECYKKRKIKCESREEVVTHLTDDGYVWRKYGQKMILKCHHPRHYYRCTHKQEQMCQATKQVQQISDNPIKYKLIYHDNHTCNNIFKISPYMMDTQEEHSSSIVLSFDGSHPINPLLFPVSRSSADTCNFTIANDMSEMTNEISGTNHVSKQSDEQMSVGVAEDYLSSTATSIHLEQCLINYSSIMPDFSEILPDLWTD